MPHVTETLATLNLSANPFAANTSVATLFPGGDRRATLEKLQHLSRYSDDIVALIGPAGSGKSIIGDFFTRQAEQDQIVARARASLLTTPTQLLEEMFKAFVLDFPPQGSIAELKAALQNYFVAVQKQGRSVVLIVDDAHELGDDAFNLLVRLALTESVNDSFRLLLLGEPQLRDMLDYTCPLKNATFQFTCLQLSPLTGDETRNYLRHRLNSVSLDRDDAAPFPFSKRQVEKIHRLAGGVPGRINAQAQMLLESPQGIMTQFLPLLSAGIPRGFPDNFPRNYAIVAVALVGALLIAFMAGDGEEEVPDTMTTVSLPLPLPGGDDTPPLNSAAVQRDLASAGNVATADAIVVPDDTVAAEPESTTESAPSIAIATPEPTTTSAPTVLPADQPGPATTLPAPVNNSVSAPANTQVGQRNRILALPSTQYTLQLMGASSRTNVEDFVRRQDSSSVYWYETRNNNRPWFVIIHGAYASRDEAQSAAAGLPGELSKLEPWIRPLSAVQAEVRAQN